MIRRERAWRRLAKGVMYLIMGCLFYAALVLIGMIPLPDHYVWRVLVSVGLWILGAFLLILLAVFSCVLTQPLWNKAEKCSLPAIKKETLSKATLHLRNYYGLSQPYLLTKCFAAADEKWKNHDVCIFIVDNELRITTDLVHGFLYGERDLGCYAFKRSEIALSKHKDNNGLKLELRAGNEYFVLGYRAKGFIERNYIND
ncbi:MAG: hypothetical protein E7322_08260 [Clostridiales bacterium]|nr:hypothetical protein [Clostridiales bacterium]